MRLQSRDASGVAGHTAASLKLWDCFWGIHGLVKAELFDGLAEKSSKVGFTK